MYAFTLKDCYLGPVVRSVVSLTSSLWVILLTVLADSIYNILIFFAEKNVSSFCTAKATHIFSAKHFSIFAYHLMGDQNHQRQPYDILEEFVRSGWQVKIIRVAVLALVVILGFCCYNSIRKNSKKFSVRFLFCSPDYARESWISLVNHLFRHLDRTNSFRISYGWRW